MCHQPAVGCPMSCGWSSLNLLGNAVHCLTVLFPASVDPQGLAVECPIVLHVWFPHKIPQGLDSSRRVPLVRARNASFQSVNLERMGFFTREAMPLRVASLRRGHPTINHLSIAANYVQQMHHALVICYRLEGFQTFH